MFESFFLVGGMLEGRGGSPFFPPPRTQSRRRLIGVAGAEDGGSFWVRERERVEDERGRGGVHAFGIVCRQRSLGTILIEGNISYVVNLHRISLHQLRVLPIDFVANILYVVRSHFCFSVDDADEHPVSRSFSGDETDQGGSMGHAYVVIHCSGNVMMMMSPHRVTARFYNEPMVPCMG